MSQVVLEEYILFRLPVHDGKAAKMLKNPNRQGFAAH